MKINRTYHGTYALSRSYPSLAAHSDGAWVITPYYNGNPQDFQKLAAEICGDTDAIDKSFEQ